jgi:glycosyltransferase involved in cell wall biosynthesis
LKLSVSLPDVLLVTRIPFWRLGNGERMRVLALVWVLGAQTRLSILFLGAFDPDELHRLRSLRIQATFIPGPGNQDPENERAALIRAFAAKSYDVCILERTYLHHLRSGIPHSCRSVLDTHDLMSRRSETKRALGLAAGDTTLQDELLAFACYDRVLLIQAEEYAAVAAQLGDRAMLVPHPVQFPRRAVEPARRRLGLVASRYDANVDGLTWFLDRVWPGLIDSKAELHVFGTICDVWDPAGDARIVRHGFVADFSAVWGSIDVAINPVRWGSGLKIKNVEALGNGLPLVTTSHAAGGLEDGAGSAFLCADTPTAFAAACRKLLAEPGTRKTLGAAAHAYAQRRFSAQACFQALMNWIVDS